MWFPVYHFVIGGIESVDEGTRVKRPQVNEGSAEREKAGSSGNISGGDRSSGDEWGTEEQRATSEAQH